MIKTEVEQCKERIDKFLKDNPEYTTYKYDMDIGRIFWPGSKEDYTDFDGGTVGKLLKIYDKLDKCILTFEYQNYHEEIYIVTLVQDLMEIKFCDFKTFNFIFDTYVKK